MMITYSHVQLNPVLEASVFQFQPPDGSHEVSAAAQASSAARSSPPVLISKHEPKYSSEARKAGLQGSVLVSLVVGADGIPQNVKVLRGLGLGLDERAGEAVQGWKFQPATKAGEPVAVPAQVEVNVRLRQP
jgi:TonB family protein